MPVHILLTKADKLNRGPAAAALAQVRRALDAQFPGTTAQLFSAPAKQGVEEAREVLDRWLEIPAL
jgi:GTP-binding protein